MSSSISRAELEAMDRDELIETIVDLSQTVDDQQLSIDVLVDRVNELEERLDAMAQVQQRLDTLEERVEDVDATAQGAYTQATGGNSGERSKTEIAKDLTRNLLIVKAANGAPAQDRPVTIADIQQRGEERGHDLAWAIVDRAWRQLREEWPQFHETSKHGNKALSIRPSKVTKPLAKTVEQDLERSDLAKRFVGGNGGEGA